MADFSDFNAAVVALSNPTTSAADLRAIALGQPQLWAQVAGHPNADPGLLGWLAQNGDATVQQALAARRMVGAAPLSPSSGPSSGGYRVPPTQGAPVLLASQGHSARNVVLVIVAIVVALVVVLGVLFGIPGTDVNGLVGGSSSNNTGSGTSSANPGTPTPPPSFSNGYSTKWSLTKTDLGVDQDMAGLGYGAGQGAQPPTLGYVAQTPSTVVVGAQAHVATSAPVTNSAPAQATILYGVDPASGQKKWSTGGQVQNATTCAQTVIDNKIYCVVDDGSGAGPQMVTVNPDDGSVSAPSGPLFTGTIPTPTTGVPWFQPASGSASPVPVQTIRVFGGDLFVTAPGSNCDELVSRVDPSTLAVMWTTDLPQADSMALNGAPAGTCIAARPSGYVGVQGDVLIIGTVAAGAFDVATGQLLYTGLDMGISAPGQAYAFYDDFEGTGTPGAPSFTDSTGATWQVTIAPVYEDGGPTVDFAGSQWGLPMDATASTPISALMLENSSDEQTWSTDMFGQTGDTFGGVYDRTALIVASSGGAVASVDPTTGKFVWQAQIPGGSDQFLPPAPYVTYLDPTTVLVELTDDSGATSSSAVDIATGNVLWTMEGDAAGADGATPGLAVITAQDGTTTFTYITPNQAPADAAQTPGGAAQPTGVGSPSPSGG